MKNEVTSCDDFVTGSMGSPSHGRTFGFMAFPSARSADTVLVRRGALTVEIALRPLDITVWRGERRLVRSLGAWVADGTVHDHFIQLTEGVVAHEDLAPVERALSASVRARSEEHVTLALELSGGRRARLEVRLPDRDRITLELDPDGEPLRAALDWRRRSDERFVGLGARHGTQLDQAGRSLQLGADRRYTGPDCPAEILAAGGIPQGLSLIHISEPTRRS